MAFLQDAPQLAHPCHGDRLLPVLLDRMLPAQRRAANKEVRLTQSRPD
jgi:hypothetical protein